MLDGKAYRTLLPDDTDPDLVPRLRDPALLNAFAALGACPDYRDGQAKTRLAGRDLALSRPLPVR